MIRRLIASNVALEVRARTGGVRINYIFGTSLKHNEVSHAIYRDFLPAALADGRYRAVPKPRVIGHGLEHMQAALDIQREGVGVAVAQGQHALDTFSSHGLMELDRAHSTLIDAGTADRFQRGVPT